jgi:hypothetical protein
MRKRGCGIPHLIRNLHTYEVAAGLRNEEDLAEPIVLRGCQFVDRLTVVAPKRRKLEHKSPTHPTRSPPSSEEESTDFFGLSTITRRPITSIYDAYDSESSGEQDPIQKTVYPHDYAPESSGTSFPAEEEFDKLLSTLGNATPTEQKNVLIGPRLPRASSSEVILEYPENKPLTYNYLNAHWNQPVSSLSSSKWYNFIGFHSTLVKLEMWKGRSSCRRLHIILSC